MSVDFPNGQNKILFKDRGTSNNVPKYDEFDEVIYGRSLNSRESCWIWLCAICLIIDFH